MSDRRKIACAEQLLQSNPDSALNLMNSIQTGLLDQIHYARYQVIRIRAKDKSGLDISSDIAIFEAQNLLIGNNDEYAAYSCLVAADVLDSRDELLASTENYLLATSYVEDAGYLKENIYYNLARSYYKQQFYLESLNYLEKLRQFDTREDQTHTFELIGLNYLFTDETDSALHYFNKALNSCSDTCGLVNLYYYFSLALRDAAQYPMAEKMCRQTFSITDPNDSIQIGRLYLTLGSIYYATHRLDSASIAAYTAKRLLERKEDNIDMIDLYKLLYQIESDMGNDGTPFLIKHKGYVLAKKYIKERIEFELEKRKDDILMVQETRNRIMVQTLIWRNTVIVLVSVMIVGLGIFFFLKYRKKEKARIDEMEEKHGDEIGKYVDEIGKCEGKIERYEHKIEKYEHEIERYADEIEEERQQHEHVINSERERFTEIRQQLGQYEQQVRLEREKINKQRLNLISRVRDLSSLSGLAYDHQAPAAVKGEISRVRAQYHGWDVVCQVINDMYEGLPDRIRADYPKLTEKEYRTCVLLSVGLDYDVISGILDDRGGTIHNRTSRIRDKLGLPSRIDLRVFFQEKYFC